MVSSAPPKRYTFWLLRLAGSEPVLAVKKMIAKNTLRRVTAVITKSAIGLLPLPSFISCLHSILPTPFHRVATYQVNENASDRYLLFVACKIHANAVLARACGKT